MMCSHHPGLVSPIYDYKGHSVEPPKYVVKLHKKYFRFPDVCLNTFSSVALYI